VTARTTAKTARTRVLRAAGLAGLLALAAACTGDTPATPTAVVDRGTVSTGVSASGSLVSITQQNLGFADRGQIAELFVKVGDAVQAGQPLARLDDAAARSQLASAQAKLDQQQASLGKLTGGNSVEAAQAALDSAGEILDATRSQVAATDDADASAVERAKVQLAFDKKQLDLAKKQLAKDQKACAAATAASSSGASPSKSLLGLGAKSEGAADTTTPSTTPTPPTTPAPTTDPACEALRTDQQAVQTAKANVVASQTALDAAEHQRDTDRATGRVNIANAESAVSDAQSQLDSAGNDAPADIDVQAAVVRDAENTVADAQQALDNTVLRAPVAGTVSAVNGAVGDFVAAAGGATPLAPGTDARIPAAAGSAGDAGTADSGGNGAFITLNDLQTFQLVVPFEESDAAQVQPNQRVDVTVDAVPGLTSPGTVVAVAPTADHVSGVVSYYATIVLTQVDPQLKDGQTAQADVLTKVVDDVLRVPAAAVRQENGRTVVSLPGSDGQPVTREFTPGLVGDSFTEVRAGLDEGQQVLLPQATVAATPNGGGGPGGGG
jgi:HlyD family secretion protein